MRTTLRTRHVMATDRGTRGDTTIPFKLPHITIQAIQSTLNPPDTTPTVPYRVEERIVN